ncbi:MAG TPA: transglycosylase SLT domain-containing protein, partial [Xanthomonadales bacterium]|nr:transglycosylase SLT domain-containing protein [Xanthomonadales bacterium]
MTHARGRVLALLFATLVAGCATAPRSDRAREPSPPEPVVDAGEPAEAPPAPAPEPARAAARAPKPPDTWTRIRNGRAFAQCDAPRVVAMRRALVRTPGRFAQQIERALPLMVLALDELERHGLPSEFVFLPMVESGYVAVESRGNRPAGMWQIMPVTARGLGLAIDAEYDGRLDAVASTRAAATLLAELGRRFDGDWRLATMAYNAGEFRVRRALRESARHGSAGPRELPLPAITHAHLARLEALACIAADPGPHGVALPEPRRNRRLAAVEADAALDLDLAAALAGETYDDFRRMNPAHRHGVVARGRSVLVRERRRARFERLLARIPPAQRAAWHRVARAKLPAAPSLPDGIDAELLAALNAKSRNGEWTVPGLPAATRAVASAAAPGAGRHTVRHGESLWLIARRYGVSVAALLDWNALGQRTVLRPGQVLRVVAPVAG